MKKNLSIIAVLFCTSLLAQTDYKKIANEAAIAADKKLASKVKDTSIVITLDINTYRQLLYVLDANIDSKKLSKEIFDLLNKSATLKEGKKD